MSFFGQNNFLIKHEYRDFYSQVQRNTERIGDKGKVSDDFLKRARAQFKNHDFNKLAEEQDKFIAPDEMYGTRGREKNRNYNRMEYDQPERHDGKEQDKLLKDVNDKMPLTADDLLGAFKKQGYDICTTASAVSADPIEEKDYKGQIKMGDDEEN